MEHKNNFDLLRLFAACQVLFMHVGGHLKLPLGTPTTNFIFWFPGVAIFFVISGFLVTDSGLRSRGVFSFFWKRALRIYPALILNLIVLDLVMLAYGQLVAINYPVLYALSFPLCIVTASFALSGYLTGIPAFYTQGFLPDYPSGVLWTLTVELSFYLIVPVVAALFRLSRAVTAFLVAAGMGASVYYASYFTPHYGAEHPFLDCSFLPYFWIFGMGMMLRLFWDKVSFLFENRAMFWLPAYIIFSQHGFTHGYFLEGLDFHNAVNPTTVTRMTLLGLTTISCALSFKGTSNAVLRGVDLSYGIYLWHMLFVTLFIAYGVTGYWWLWIVVPACAVAAAAISRYAVELPALRLKRRPVRDGVASSAPPAKPSSSLLASVQPRSPVPM